MALISNPTGQDPLEYYENTAADRIGQRIKEIRTSIGKSQVSLGEDVGLDGTRIYKYENGERKPKRKVLSDIAKALGVSPLALMDPVINDFVGVMYALFSLEKRYNLKIYRNETGELVLSFGDGKTGIINNHLKAWEEKSRKIRKATAEADSEEEKKRIIQEYNMWRWNYPNAITRETAQRLSDKEKAERKAELEAQRKQIEKELSELNN